MANLNFPPNPAAQTPANTFGPNTTPASTSNGVNYIYDGSKWVADFSGSTYETPDLQAVTVEGNTTSLGANFGGTNIRLLSGGDITASGSITAAGSGIFGDFANNNYIWAYPNNGAASGQLIVKFKDSITNPASNLLVVGTDVKPEGFVVKKDGNVVAAGGITSNSYLEVRDTTVSDATSVITVQRDGESSPTFAVFANGTTAIGGLIPASPNITLASDGDITAVGNIQTGGDSLSGLNDGIVLAKNGTSYFAAADGLSAINCYTTGNGTPTSQIFADGSAYFAGTMKIGRIPPLSPNIELNADGQIDAAGDVVAASFLTGGQLYSGYGTGTGLVRCQQNTGTNNAFVVEDSNNNFTATIRGDGSITAAGRIKTQKDIWIADETGGQSLAIYNSSGTSSSQNAIGISDNAGGTPKTIELKYDGSATFKGEIVAGVRDSQGVFMTPAGVAESWVNGSRVWNLGSNGAATFAASKVVINADGSSVFNNYMQVYRPIADPGGALCTYKSDYSGSPAQNSVKNIYADGTTWIGGNFNTSSPNIRLNANGMIVSRGGDSGTLYKGQNGASGGDKIIFQDNGDGRFDGTLTATVVPPSDARFKENITPAKPQLADVVALGGLLKNYDWNDEAPLNEELRSVRQLGLVAQEVAEVCPSIVKDIHRTKTVEVKPAVTGPKGRVITEAVTEEVDDSYKGLSQEALIMKLIGAVAELKAELDELKGA